MLTPPKIKMPLRLLNERRIKEYLEHFTDKSIWVAKTDKDLTIYIGDEKVYLPLLADTHLMVEPVDLVNSLKEKGLIP